jgi:hypothetical protein
VKEIALGVILLGVLIGLIRLLLGWRTLADIFRSSHEIRRIGKVRVLVHEELRIPFSFWMPGKAYVVIPGELLNDRALYKLAVLHELQHHRQGDTRWVHFFQAIKLGFFWNPIVHFWETHISNLQEFACDETLVSMKGVSPHAYGSCLVRAAEISLNAHCLPVGTTGMAVGCSGQKLKRRINMMFDYKSKKVSRVSSIAMGTFAVAILATVAFASQGVIKDRRITLADAQTMAQTASQGSEFPIVVNNAVVEELNLFLGTPDGRSFIRDSVARMQNYRPMIESKIQSYGLPIELMAIPIIESGYMDSDVSSHPTGHEAAGLWQFIVSTAKHYDLRVDDQVDERLNANLETDAAMRYLSSNYLRFNDWLLAVLAYNSGEKNVQAGIDNTGSRDAWKLIDAGFDGDQNYLAKMMAAVLILKNPSVLN